MPVLLRGTVKGENTPILSSLFLEIDMFDDIFVFDEILLGRFNFFQTIALRNQCEMVTIRTHQPSENRERLSWTNIEEFQLPVEERESPGMFQFHRTSQRYSHDFVLCDRFHRHETVDQRSE